VHLSHQAIPPPGEARSDFEIFLDYARRMRFRDRDGGPLVPWSTPEEAFDHFKELTRGRPCDYSGMTYAKLAAGPIQWPCTDRAPGGTPRLYTDFEFPTEPDFCEEYGHDLVTGAGNDDMEYRALNPAGRAFLKAVHHTPPHEQPSDDYPFQLTTGRTVHHWHTRTKTARAPELQAAAPEVWVEVSTDDAARLGLAEGDWALVESRRGSVRGRVRITDARRGTVFVPFHYGYWDRETFGPEGPGRAANELTLTAWDPVSKQPTVKSAAVRVTRVETPSP
jgi:anaerobic selenocysteine-containing dehydrogenase